SDPRDDLPAFTRRCQEAAHREGGKAYEAERLKYLPKFNALNLPMPSLSEQQTAGGGILSWLLGSAPAKTPKQVALEAEWKGRVAALFEKWRQIGEEHTELLLTPRKVDVQVTAFGLAWAPFAHGAAAYK